MESVDVAVNPGLCERDLHTHLKGVLIALGNGQPIGYVTTPDGLSYNFYNTFMPEHKGVCDNSLLFIKKYWENKYNCEVTFELIKFKDESYFFEDSLEGEMCAPFDQQNILCE